MDKHDILKKARKSKKDEREKQLENNSYKFGWFGATLAITILLLFRFYNGEPWTDLILIVMVQMVFRVFYQMLNETDTYHTLTFIISLGGLILVSILMLIEHGVL